MTQLYKRHKLGSSSSSSSYHPSNNIESLSVIRRHSLKCPCNEICVVRTGSDFKNVNCGKKFFGCRNYKDMNDKSCGFFNCVDVDTNERDLKIGRQKKKMST